MFALLHKLVCGTALTAGLVFVAPAARADDPPDMHDYNTYWQVAQDPNPPNPNLDYNTYWAEVQAKEQSGPNR